MVGTGSVDVESNAVTNDSAGNVYVTGSLQGTADFDTGSGSANLSSTGGRDVFVAKYTKAGNLVWSKDLHGSNGASVAQAAAVVVDGQGNVFVSGTFTGGLNFDPNGGNTTFNASNGNDAFVAKYDANGNLLWARDITETANANGQGYAQGYALAVDASGNLAVAGSFTNSATFGTTSLTASGFTESFVTKLNSRGAIPLDNLDGR